MDTSVVGRQFAISAHVAGNLVAGVSDAESLISAPAGGNCMNWVLGHMVTYRGSLIELLGGRKIWDEKRSGPYSFGSENLRPDSPHVPFAEIAGDFRRSQEEVKARLKEAAPEIFARPLDKPNDFLGKTVGTAVTSLAFHDSYHCGQLAILRRFLGKEVKLG